MKRSAFVAFLTLLSSCSNEPNNSTATPYFDLKKYFHEEAFRLKKKNPLIQKTVAINGLTEKKTLRLPSWYKELDIFASADINKASWRGAFKVEDLNGRITYKSSSDQIDVKQVKIFTAEHRIQHINIILRRKNILYTSIDTLDYFPDSLYSIRKKQAIRLLRARNYKVVGKF